MSIIKKFIKLYNKIPIGVFNAIAPVYYCVPESKRYGSVFSREKTELERIKKMSSAELELETNTRLRRLIMYAYEHVPYYRNLFDKHKINPNDIKSEQDLQRIPLLTKEIVSEHRKELISDEFTEDDLIYITTSGSTGAPTGFYVQNDSHIRDWVYVLKLFEGIGYNTKSKKLMLRGKRFWSQNKGKNWQWDAFRRELSVSIFDMDADNLEEYCRKIEHYKPDFAYGYTSAMYSLCKYIQLRGGIQHQFKGFIGISETIYDEQRAFIESVINAPVVSFYGMSERVVIAGQKNSGGNYYVEPQYGIAELIDSDGNVITEANVRGEIVGTSLLNYGMPLIRYKMGDISSWTVDHNEKTYYDDKWVLNDIEGRKKKDVLINKDGLPVSMASLEVHSHIYDYIVRYQFVQEEIGKVIIRVVPIKKESLTAQLLKDIEKTFSDRVNGKMIFKVEVVDRIDPKANGKLSIVDQRLDVDRFIL